MEKNQKTKNRNLGDLSIRLSSSAAILLLLRLLVMIPVSQAATTTPATIVDHLQLSGQGVFAGFDSIDASGCIETFVFVEGGNLLERAPSAPRQFSQQLAVDIFRINLCTGFPLLTGLGGADTFNLQIPHDLGQAHIQVAQVPVLDLLTNTLSYVDVNLSWNATDHAPHTAGTTVINGAGMTTVFTTEGVTRNAVATGTITDGTTNYIPQPSTQAEIQQATGSQTTITRS